MLKIGQALLVVAFFCFILFSSESTQSYVSTPLTVALVGLFFIGVHCSRNALTLAQGNKVVMKLYQISPLMLPFLIYMVWRIAS